MPISESRLESASQLLNALRREITKTYLGQPEVLDGVLIALLAEGHVLLEGVPGVAKTTLAKSCATALGCPMRRIQFTPDLLPSEITGSYVLDPRDASFSLREGPVFSSIVVADEINRAPAKTQAALLEAMQEAQVTIEGESRSLPQPFMVIATQNPIDLEGTYPLPEAQLDRFMVHLKLDYPSEVIELEMLKTYGAANPLTQPVTNAQELLSLRKLAKEIHCEEDVMNLAVQLCRQTRSRSEVLLGASPRASLVLLQAAKAWALLSARSYVTPEDIRHCASPVLSHRLILRHELENDSSVREKIIQNAFHDAASPITRGPIESRFDT
ncbi:MAG: MoxR family ATPase [Polyangiaceae bacterium]|nr:MoxR family ATPase [Polyangiaceae bacterium]